MVKVITRFATDQETVEHWRVLPEDRGLCVVMKEYRLFRWHLLTVAESVPGLAH